MDVDRPGRDGNRAQKGRGFREPMDTDRAPTGGDYESLPTDRSGGPGPAKCKFACSVLIILK